jgi:hypothetical protein
MQIAVLGIDLGKNNGLDSCPRRSFDATKDTLLTLR